jgi:hypothetical protein
MVSQPGSGAIVSHDVARDPSRVVTGCGTVGDESTEAAAVAGGELVEFIDEPRRSDHAKEPSQRPAKSQLREENDTATRVARHECSVRQDEPPTVVPPLFRHVGEQSSSGVVGEREQGQLIPTIEPRDDTRREPAEPSGSRVEKNRAWKAELMLDSRHGHQTPGRGTAVASRASSRTT